MAGTIWTGQVLGCIYALVPTGSHDGDGSTGVSNFARGAIVAGGRLVTYQLLSGSRVPSAWALMLTAPLARRPDFRASSRPPKPLGGRGEARTTPSSPPSAINRLAGPIRVKWERKHATGQGTCHRRAG